MTKGIDTKRCSCNKALDDLMGGLAERIRREKYFKNMSTAGKLVNLQSVTPIPEIADCDCDAGLAIKEIKEILRGRYNKKVAKNKGKAITVFISPIRRKIEQKIRSIFPRRC